MTDEHKAQSGWELTLRITGRRGGRALAVLTSTGALGWAALELARALGWVP